MTQQENLPSASNTRTKIGTVAEVLFAERGFEGTSIQAIAEAAGIAKALIYHHYQSKEGLYLAVLENAVSKVVAAVEEIAANQDAPQAKIRAVARAFLDQDQACPQQFHLVQRAIDQQSPAAVALAERWFSRVHQALQAIIEEGGRQGIFKPRQPQLTTFTVSGLIIHTLRTHKLMDRISPPLSGMQLLDVLPALLLDLLMVDGEGNKTQFQERERGKGNPDKQPVFQK